MKTFMLFRCTESKYADSFRSAGNMKFNTPQYWIDLEKKEGKGRGDLLEAVHASFNIKDINAFILCKDLRSNSVVENKGAIAYLRNEDICKLPCYCLFSLDDRFFPNTVVDKYGQNRSLGRIDKQYFKDFFEESKDYVQSLPEDERPVLLIISNPHEFFKRVRQYFVAIGFKPEEILISPVQYINKNIPFICNMEAPFELFLKDESYSHQSEVRIVINTKNVKLLHKIKSLNGVINIGSLEDIVDIEKYYYDDFVMEKVDNTLRYVLSEPRYTRIQPPPKLPKEQLLAVYEGIKNGSIRLRDYDEELTKLSVIQASLKEYYNIDVEI